MDRDSKLFAPGAEDRKKPLAADGGESMPTRCEHLAPKVHIDVIPDCEVLGEPLIEGGVGVLDADQCLVREDNTKPKRVVHRVSLPDLDPLVWVEELYERRQI